MSSYARRAALTASSFVVVLALSPPASAQLAQPSGAIPEPLPESSGEAIAPTTPEAEASEIDPVPSGAIASPPIDALEEAIAPAPDAESYVARALRGAASMRAEDARRRDAEWAQFRAKYAWAPRLDADALLAPVPAQTDPNNVGNNVDEFFDLNIGPFVRLSSTLVFPLYTFGRISKARALADVGVRNAALERRKAELDLAFQVRQAYWGVRLSRALAAMIDDGASLIGERLEQMQDARDFGDADFSTKDFRKLQIFDTELAARSLENEKLSDLGAAALRYLTDDEALDLAAIAPLTTPELPPELAPFEQYVERAGGARPELAQLERAIEARSLELDLKRAEFFPNIFFAANFNFGWSTEQIARQRVFRQTNGRDVLASDLSVAPFSNPYEQLGFGFAIGARWNVSFLDAYGKYGETESQLAQLRAQASQAQGAVRLEIRKLYVELDHARRRIEISARRLEAARRWRDQVGLSAQTAGADLSDAIEPLRAYYEARVEHLRAWFDYHVAAAAMAKGIGAERPVE